MAGAIGSTRRAGEIWTDEEYLQLVEWLREGVTTEQIADWLGRGVAAVRARLRLLVTPGVALAAGEVERWLRERLSQDPDYDWHVGLRAEAERAGRFYWSAELVDALRAGWERQLPMADLTRLTGASDVEVATQVVRMGLADTVAAVALRTRCGPAGTLALRARMALDRAAAAVWVLVVDGAHGSQRARMLETDEGKMFRHISIHASNVEAEAALDRILVEHHRRVDDAVALAWTIAERTVGEEATGVVRHGRLPA
jgi:hypothetical protein